MTNTNRIEIATETPAKTRRRPLHLMLRDLRALWSVTLFDTAEGWRITLATVAENGDILEFRYADGDVYDAVQKAWAIKGLP